jgi:hypothetical protein
MNASMTTICAAVCAGAACAWVQGFARYQAPRSASIGAEGVAAVRIDAGAGSLRVEGRPDLQEIRAHGTAWSSREDLLEKIQISAAREGDRVTIRTEFPEDVSEESMRLDLVVEVPSTTSLDVEDGSGSVEIRSVAAATVRDGSGSIEIANVAGDVSIHDGSGSIDVREAGGLRRRRGGRLRGHGGPRGSRQRPRPDGRFRRDLRLRGERGLHRRERRLGRDRLRGRGRGGSHPSPPVAHPLQRTSTRIPFEIRKSIPAGTATGRTP